jgi:tetratricopeptide (TPR) repeat protein
VLITADGAAPGPPPAGVAYLVSGRVESSKQEKYQGVAPIMLAVLARISKQSSITLAAFAEAVRSESQHIQSESSARTNYEVAFSFSTIGNLTLFERLDPGVVQARPDQRSETSIHDDMRSPVLSRQRESVRSLPPATSLFIGRADEIAALERAWGEQITTLVQIIGSGGSGKTALVTTWAQKHKDDAPVFAWSFYDQGAIATADSFFTSLLSFLELGANASASPSARLELLAKHLAAERLLLILDGLERLQDTGGRLVDVQLRNLLQRLAVRNKGLVVCTSRVPLAEVPARRILTINLQSLSPTEGVEYLRAMGVTGPDDELRDASIQFGNNVLALQLLGNYLRESFDGDVRRRSAVASRVLDGLRRGKQIKARAPIRSVFLSSTGADLSDFREAANRALESLAVKPIRMEDYGASSRDPIEISIDLIASADAFVGIYGFRLGYVPPGQEASLIELEYREARQRGLPVIVFLIADEVHRRGADVGADQTRILKFRSHVMRDTYVQLVQTSAELEMRLRSALLKLVDSDSQSSVARREAEMPQSIEGASSDLVMTEAIYRETLQRAPSDLTTRNALAEVLRKTRRLTEAEGVYRETLERFPEALGARNGLARVLREIGRPEEAEQLYRETLRHFPEDLSTRN